MVEELRENNITCPYCKTENIDSWEIREDSDDKYLCDDCGKYFSWSRQIHVEYTSTPDCELNNEEHDFPEYEEVIEKIDKDGYFRCRYCNKCNEIDFINTDKDGNKIKK